MTEKLMKKKNFDPNEDGRLKGTFWTYWDRSLHEYAGPEIEGSVLAYTTQSPAMGKVTPGKVGFPTENQNLRRK